MRLTLGVEQNVARLDVAMQDAALMRVMHGAGETGNDLCGLSQPNRFATDKLIELAALFQLHAEVARSVAFADFVNRDDSGMLQSRDRFRLATKPLQVRLTCAMPKPNDFKRDPPVEAFLTRAINNALAAAPDFLKQFVIAKLRHDCFRPVRLVAVEQT